MEFITTKLALQEMFKGLLKGCNQKQEYYERKNFTGKGKHIVNIADQPTIMLVMKVKRQEQ